MNKILLTILVLFLMSCENLPKNAEQWMAREKNACLPTAIAFKQGLDRQGIQSEVVVYTYKNEKDKLAGHAIVAYLYPPGKNQLWTYDFMGSWRTRAFFNDPYNIAFKAEQLRGRNRNIEFAEFIK